MKMNLCVGAHDDQIIGTLCTKTGMKYSKSTGLVTKNRRDVFVDTRVANYRIRNNELGPI